MGIDDIISNFKSQPRPCCGFQDVNTILEFVLGVRHYQVDLDVRLDEYEWFAKNDIQSLDLDRKVVNVK